MRVLTSDAKWTRTRGGEESDIPVARKASGLDARRMQSSNDSSEADNGAGEPLRPFSEAPAAADPSQIPEGKLRLWTAWLDYSATGEGRAYMACIAFAKSKDEILSHFGRKFHPWYATGCEVGEGILRNRVTTLLWSGTLLDHLELAADQGAWVEAHSWMHFNMLCL